MPLPNPKTGESKEKWIDRCMSSEAMQKEYPDNDQRLAVCHQKWRDKDSATLAERRLVPFSGEMRAVAGEDGKMIIEGYPIVYETYAPLWGFREIIRKGAATEALKRSDELVLWDHESSQPMARRSAGTLEAREDEHGVFIRADVSKTRWGRDGYEAILNGIINKMSFAFDIATQGDRWFWEEIEGVKIETREILAFNKFYDYSPVSYPAYVETEVTARCRELALRHRPEPEASGEGDRSLSEVGRLRLQAESHDLKTQLEGTE